MTAGDLEDRFLAHLLRTNGGIRRRWRLVLGGVRTYDVTTHPHCNWSVTPRGSAAENEAVEAAADELRARFPIVVEDER